ncbi:MAG: LamB/YcsF family protein [Firmicutes bacterium]|nr:LamB/YcsF family protein [Bacillota bacterium]MBQ2058513.1 LamB/YcsF family protein [Bacillota bacterium]MBQ4371269.1 LamB/YcsF family protein [Bacillota bacterium]
MYKVDLNSDLGESFGNYKLGCDEEVTKFVSSVNVACGFHAGDPLVMAKTLELARINGAAVGAHPGYPDLQGFGRRKMDCTPAELKAYTLYQLGALDAFCRASGLKMQHVKPHGMMYNTIAVDEVRAMAVAEAIAEFDSGLIFLALAGSRMITAAEKCGLRTASEVFADRAYMPDGTLTPRSMEGSVIRDRDEAIARTVRMIKEGVVTAINGEDIPIRAESVCVHGDNPKAVEFVRTIRERLEAEGIEIAPIREVIA